MIIIYETGRYTLYTEVLKTNSFKKRFLRIDFFFNF